MGDEMSPIMPAPPSSIDGERNPAAQMALALVVLGMLLAVNGVLTDAWLVEEGDFEAEFSGITMTGSFSNETGLNDYSTELCLNGECNSTTMGLQEAYDNCSEILDDFGANESTIEDSCGAYSDLANAGMAGTISIWIGVALFLFAAVLQVMAVMGRRNILTNIMPFASGAIVGLGVLLWYLLLPETESDPEWGYSLWFAIISTLAGILASFTPQIQSLIDGPPRMRARGVRSGTDMSEFVLKESSCGNYCLSVLVDDDLIRVVNVKRIGASPQVSDLMAANRSAYSGFSHQRIDWLDDFRGIWWVLAGASLISIFSITPWFTITFVFGLLMALAQLMDPERFVISTNAGSHSFIINRWRSNRELTNLAMDLVDEAMINVLRGNDLDTSAIDNRAELIAERFQLEQKDKQQVLEQNDQHKQTVIQVVAQSPVIETPAAELPTPPVLQQVVIPETASPVVEKSSDEGSEQDAPSPEVVTVEKTPLGPTINEEAPSTVPAMAIPPPPPLPVTAPAAAPIVTPPPAQVPPPPMVAPPIQMPPPPMGDSSNEMMPPPPPPGGAVAIPPAPMPAPVAPPTPVVVQAAPREENMSADEKDNIMGDLMES